MKKTTILLFAIILVASFLRFYQITTNPKAMYGDGLTLVYDAYSILKTGYDQKGEFMPLVFSLGGGRPGGYIYATIPFTVLFGPTALAARMVSVLSGIGIILLLYLLGKHFFSEKAGLVIAAVGTINPWGLSLSRGPFETHFALFLALLGFYSFIKGLKKTPWFIVFGLTFGLASQTYSTYRLIIPLFTILLLIWTGKKLTLKYARKPIFLFSLAIIIASTILGLYLTISRGDKDRFTGINIFSDQSLRSSISQKVKTDRSLDSLSPTNSNKLHTPQMEMAGVLAENYIKNFLPDFLFLHGDGEVRHNPAEMGEFFWIDAFFLFIGVLLIYKHNKRLSILLAGWILIAPVATSLVGEPHALRNSFLLPPILIIAGFGLWKFWEMRKKGFNSLIIIFLAIILLLQFIVFVDRFYFVAPQKNERSWSLPAKKAAIIALENRQKFKFVILSNNIDNMEFAYPVYAKLDPNLVIKQNQNPAKIGEFNFFKYDNVYIGSLPNTRIMQFIKDLPGSAVYIGSDKEKPYLSNYAIISGSDAQPNLIITSKDGKPDLNLEGI